MSNLDLSDFFNGEMDMFVETMYRFNEAYSKTVMSACVVDTADKFPINDLENMFPDIYSKYIDLSQCKEGDYLRFCEHLSQFEYEGLLIDNIDRIPNNADREDWEAFVRFALKRETEFPLLPFHCISFDERHIGARCRRFPEYLNGKSLQSDIIKVDNNTDKSDADSL